MHQNNTHGAFSTYGAAGAPSGFSGAGRAGPAQMLRLGYIMSQALVDRSSQAWVRLQIRPGLCSENVMRNTYPPQFNNFHDL
jgi:hypothetical protein